MPKLYIDTDEWEMRVAKDPEAKLDNNGIQRRDKSLDLPLWATQVFVRDTTGGDVILITTAGEKPEVKAGQLIDVDRLEAIPWATSGRNGVAYRAADLYEVDED